MTEYKIGDRLRGVATWSAIPDGEVYEGEFRGEYGRDGVIEGWPKVYGDDDDYWFLDTSKPIEIINFEPPRVSVLTEAASLITGDRNKTYGSPTENFANIAALWNVQIGHKLTTPLTAADVAQLMVQVKMARMIAQPKRDNYVDAAGYLACGWECEDAE
jgi:hypothetical protein